MKQAILITAYKDFSQLRRLVQEFDDNFNIYIHIDKKSSFNETLKDDFLQMSNVRYVSQDFKVNWGGVNHLKAYLKLSEVALTLKENGFFHLITGQDFPIQSNKDFRKYLVNGQNHLSAFTMPNKVWKYGGMDRIELFNFYDLFNAKKTSKWIYLTQRLQLRFKFKRPVKKSMGQLYGGNTYWSLTREAVQYVVTHTQENPKFLKRFNFTFCAEEMYFQTVLMNSSLKQSINHDDLRYMDWTTGRGGNPAFLDETDFESIINSRKLFARKLSQDRNALFEMLSKYRQE
ncbi:beta-1,6-N-acetylglucosaminyltransferase [uncultured Dokdonia sp.]|uniref:beta-1,6-N-acetylglucosaminyltransferase n=1 Tax=Dokdonia sp. R78006 TaxID=3093866 RepID=UPI002613A841|nr:beta-1,6-N-acetylglucosaminyltransferase [uncultured Dokdonia sp.]